MSDIPSSTLQSELDLMPTTYLPSTSTNCLEENIPRTGQVLCRLHVHIDGTTFREVLLEMTTGPSGRLHITASVLSKTDMWTTAVGIARCARPPTRDTRLGPSSKARDPE